MAFTVSPPGRASTITSGNQLIADVPTPISTNLIAFLLDPSDPDSVAFYLRNK